MTSSVVMVQDMEKDRTIEARFNRYFAGAALPPLDLSEAKRQVFARSRRRKRGLIGGIVSAVTAVAATLLIGFVIILRSILFGVLGEGGGMPDLSAPVAYSLSETTSAPASFTELSGKYDVIDSLAPFSLSNNSSAQYTLYYSGEKEVLLRADLRYINGMKSFRATVWCDLTEGTYNAEDFEEYRVLIPEGRSYGSVTEYINGEYVSRACMMKGETEYVIDMMSPSSGSLDMLVSMLQK